uniref:P-type ATPase C-terminal domain-containing protein n=1 Tax=Calidris pygmaea TaxID=425635 RepID=A0A8C3J200_9CHAR
MSSRQDVSAKKSLEFPELYVIGQQDELFNYRVFSVTLLHGVSTSLASFYITLWAFQDRVGSRAVGDYESFAVTVATSALLSIILDTKFWTALSFLMVTASLMLFCLLSFLTQNSPHVTHHIPSAQVMVELGAKLYFGGGHPCSPCVSPLGVRACLGGGHSPDLPVSLQKICLKARREPEPSVELRAHVPRGSFHRRSSYAFSHQEGYAGLITRGDSLRAGAARGTTPGLLRPETTPALSSLPSPSV